MSKCKTLLRPWLMALPWAVFWLLLPMVVAGQEDVITDPPASDEVGLSHGDSGRFLEEQTSCLKGLFGVSQKGRFEYCAQGLIKKYSGVQVSYDEYAGIDPVTKPSRVNWPAFPMKE